ncbi:DUF771 domain-containing protein [Limosilactobacillus mucosae]|uniref:DUF771 domain-containing protein n=1 Tax=Limosilactobacillus mucosae TaxID=97478 RepID=UPI0002503D73|nr:DUF771 domain-containing protein [Limosilactobacillus mucosae]
MELVIDDKQLMPAVKETIKQLGLVPEQSLKGLTWSVDEFRHECLGGKSRAWVKREIFDRYPETYIENGGFIVDPFPGTGRKTIIYAYDASLWVNEHYREFNWRS